MKKSKTTKQAKVSKSGFKKRLAIFLTKYYKKTENVRVYRTSPLKMRNYIAACKDCDEFSIKVIYKPEIENESVRGNKKYILNILSMFTTKEMIEDALTY